MIVILIGRKGVGKTTFGQLLAKKTGMNILSATTILDNYISSNGLLNTPENRLMVKNILQGEANSGSIFEANYMKTSRGTIVDSVVYKADLDFFESQKNEKKFVISIKANNSKRLSKILQRHREGDPVTENEIIELENNHMHDFDMDLLYYDYNIINNYNIDFLNNEVEKIISILKDKK